MFIRLLDGCSNHVGCQGFYFRDIVKYNNLCIISFTSYVLFPFILDFFQEFKIMQLFLICFIQHYLNIKHISMVNTVSNNTKLMKNLIDKALR